MSRTQNLTTRALAMRYPAEAPRKFYTNLASGRKARRGNNVTQSDLIRRHRNIRSGLAKNGYKGEVLSLDWPAKGNAANDLEDRSDADDRNSIAKTNGSFSQICYVAADVSSKEMAETSSKSNSLYRHCVRLTNYHNPYDSVLKLSNVKRIGVAPRAGGVSPPDPAPAKAVSVDCGVRFFKAHPSTNPVVDPISHGLYFDDPFFLKDFTFTLAGDMDRNVIPTCVATRTLTLPEK